MSKEEILLDRVIILSNFCVLGYTFHRFISSVRARLYRLKILTQSCDRNMNSTDDK